MLISLFPSKIIKHSIEEPKLNVNITILYLILFTYLSRGNVLLLLSRAKIYYSFDISKYKSNYPAISRYTSTPAATLINTKAANPSTFEIQPFVNFPMIFLLLEICRLMAINTGAVSPYRMATRMATKSLEK